MKLQLIHKSDYLFALEKAEDKLVLNAVVNENLEVITTKMVKWNLITHHLPLNNAPVLEGIELLPPLEAKEDYKYTEEDMVEFANWIGEEWYPNGRKECWDSKELNSARESKYLVDGTKELLHLWKEQQPNLPTSFDTETKQYIYGTN